MMSKENNMTFNITGGQVNIASDSANINAIQNNGIAGEELDKIIKNIKESLSSLKKDDAGQIVDVVDMVQDEMKKSEPRSSRLRNCLSLLAPMMTIANGIPTLSSNLLRLQEFVLQVIK